MFLQVAITLLLMGRVSMGSGDAEAGSAAVRSAALAREILVVAKIKEEANKKKKLNPAR